MTEGKSETDRIKEAYARRKENIPSEFYSLFNPANLYMIQRRDQYVVQTFNSLGISDLHNKRILDIGCGSGSELRNFMRYGAMPENLSGIDLLPDKIEMARELSPHIEYQCGDASELSFEEERFDIVMQYTVFTSILDRKMKMNIAAEMIRVLKPDGIILWYDYHMNNPYNPDVRGVKKNEILELFPGCDIFLKRITLAPPVTRVVAPVSTIACQLLEKITFLCTHYLAVIKKH
jgi:ubiquinone/menaquinone biosynthesis C-methylase UbiE